MRRLTLFVALLICAACGSGNITSTVAAANALATAMTQAGVSCARHPPPSVQACAGKSAGDACEEIDDDGAESGTCKAIPDGRLVCDDDERDGGEAGHDDGRGFDGGVRLPPAPLTDACSGKAAGATCAVTFDGRSFSGLCRSVLGFTVCLPAPEPPPAPIAACAGKSAGAACTVSFGDRSFDGSCRAFDNGTVACLPSSAPSHPPAPPAAAVDACVDHKAQDACAFSFGDHTFAGACVTAPSGTLVCAPLCHP